MAKRHDRKARLALAERLDLTAAAPLAKALLAHRGTALSIDAAPVQRAGVPCMQVLLSAVATWKADGAPIAIENASAEFRAAARTLGIAPADLMMADCEAEGATP